MRARLRRLAAASCPRPIRFYRALAVAADAAVLPLQPTCSAYALEAIAEHGPLKGLWLTAQAAGALPSHHLARRFVGLRSCSSFQSALRHASMNNNKNVLLAIALSAACCSCWQYFVATPADEGRAGAPGGARRHQEKTKPAAAARQRPDCPASPPAASHLTPRGGAEGGRRARRHRHADGGRLDPAQGRALRRSAPEELSRDRRSQEPGDRAAGAQEHRLSLLRRVRLGRQRREHARRQQRVDARPAAAPCRPAIR